MNTFLFIMLLLYLFSAYFLFERMRNIWNFVTMVLGLILFLNDWNNTVVPDSTLKLAYMLSFLFYGLIVFYHVNYIWEEK